MMFNEKIKIIGKKIWEFEAARIFYLYLSLVVVVVIICSKQTYYGVSLFCFNYRQLYNYDNKNDTPLTKLAVKHYQMFLHFIIKKYVSSKKELYISFLRSKGAKGIRKYFYHLDDEYLLRMKYPRKNDFIERQGDLMILKPYCPNTQEKGVIIIHFTEVLAKFAAIFNLMKIAEKYRIILEPSWWGYQNPYFLFYLCLPTDIVIECPFEKDFEFISNLKRNFYPIRLGAGDWVNHELFVDGKNEPKKFDLVMVGNWSKIKRHIVLFGAVEKMSHKEKIRIALIGYSSHNRTKKDIMKEAEKFNLAQQITIFEDINAVEVAELLRKSKVNLLLSKGEGANRGIFEGLFSGNVLVVYKYNKGVNKSIINNNTGYLAADDELCYVLRKAINDYYNFSTGKWARNNTGYMESTNILNEMLKKIALENNEVWASDIVPKKNQPNNLYAQEDDRIRLTQNYQYLKECIHPPTFKN